MKLLPTKAKILEESHLKVYHYISFLIILLLVLGCKKANEDCNVYEYPNAPIKERQTEVTGSEEESHGHYILTCSDGGYLQIGETGFISNSTIILVVKTNQTGSLIWKKEFGSSGNNLGNSAIETSDGYIVYESLNKNSVLIKLDKIDGSPLFIKSINNGGNDAFEKLIMIANGIVDGGLNILFIPDSNPYYSYSGYFEKDKKNFKVSLPGLYNREITKSKANFQPPINATLNKHYKT